MIGKARQLYQNCLPPGVHEFMRSVVTGAGIGGATAAAAFVMNRMGAPSFGEQPRQEGFAEREARRHAPRSHHGARSHHGRS